MYMYAHPGKKLNFMGNEIGQLREWDERREQDWEILEYPVHDSFARFMKDLNLVYAAHPAFWEKDFEEKGFQWIDCHQEEKCIYAIERRSRTQRIAAVFNFSDTEQEYEWKLMDAKSMTLLINSDNEIYNGTGKYKYEQQYKLKKGMVKLELPAFSGAYFEIK